HQQRAGDDVGDHVLDFENLQEVFVGLLPAFGFVAGDRFDLLGVGQRVFIVVQANGQAIDQILFVQQRLGVVHEHVDARVIDRRHAGGKNSHHAGGAFAAGAAGQRDDVAHLGAGDQGDTAADDDAIGGGAQLGEIALHEVLGDGGDAHLLLGVDAENRHVHVLGAIGHDRLAGHFRSNADHAGQGTYLAHQAFGVFDLFDDVARLGAIQLEQRILVLVDGFQDRRLRFARLVVDLHVAGGFHGFDDELVLKPVHHRVHGDE